MFRTVLGDFMLAQEIAADEDSDDLDEYFKHQQNYYVHLEKHASEDWVAEDDQNNIVGWARSIERDDHLQLTHFFVDTKTQDAGVGHALLDKAFPLGQAAFNHSDSQSTCAFTLPALRRELSGDGF
jgi:ribosomal protein S18 acetylase RimI-like enzyme